MRAWWMLACALPLAACDEGPEAVIPPQIWQGYEVRIETRPPQATRGMNEVLVIATQTQPRRIPVWDMVVNVRASDQQNWIQAIQDGRTGVYRRAVAVSDPAKELLQVQLQRQGAETVLYFPLLAPPVPH